MKIIFIIVCNILFLDVNFSLPCCDYCCPEDPEEIPLKILNNTDSDNIGDNLPKKTNNSDNLDNSNHIKDSDNLDSDTIGDNLPKKTNNSDNLDNSNDIKDQIKSIIRECFVKKYPDNFVDLIVEYCLRNDMTDLSSFGKIEHEKIKKSLNDAEKVTINYNNGEYRFFIKKDEEINSYYIDILKKIDLCQLDYINNKKYLLTEALDLTETMEYRENFIGRGIGLNVGKNLDSAKAITNFKELCFFCSLLKLVDCHPFYRTDNCYISNNKISLLDVNKTKKDLNEFQECSTEDEKIKYFFETLRINTKLRGLEFARKEYIENIDNDLDKFLAALIFVLKEKKDNTYFFSNKILLDGKKLNGYEVGDWNSKSLTVEQDELEIFKPENPLQSFWKGLNPLAYVSLPFDFANYREVGNFLNLEENAINSLGDIKTKLREKYKDNGYKNKADFLSSICEELWTSNGCNSTNFQNEYGKKENFEYIMKYNIEEAKKILQALKNAYEELIKPKEEMFYFIMNLENWTDDDKLNIINKTITILDYLKKKLDEDSKDKILRTVVNNLLSRLASIEKANIFTFLFENEDLTAKINQLKNK